MTIYWREAAALETQSSRFGAVRVTKKVLDEELERVQQDSALSSAGPLLQVVKVEANILARRVDAKVKGTLEAELRAAALRIERELGEAIRASVLPITKLAPQVESFIVAPPGKDASSVSLAEASGGKHIATLNGIRYDVVSDVLPVLYLLQRLESEANTLLADDAQVKSGADFSSCSVGVVEAPEPKVESPFMLGVDNADHGQTKMLTPGGQITLQLIGGRAPFDAKLVSASEDLTLRILPIGATYALVIATTETTKKGATYQVLVSDAAGALRKLLVKIPE